MLRTFQVLFLLGILGAGCSDTNSSSGSLKIEREYETIHEEGLGTVRFFEPRQLEEDLWAMCFSVPPTFLNAGSGSSNGGAAVDPFAEPTPSEGERNAFQPTAQEMLERAGIVFGEGHYARYYPADSALVVVLPKDQMELVEAYTCSIGPGPAHSILIYTEVYEIEEAFHLQLVDSLKGEGDHTPERDALFTSAKAGESTLAEASILSSQSGMRAKTEAEDALSKVEIDPVLSADYRHVNLSYRYEQGSKDEKEGSAGELSLDTQLTFEPGKYVSLGSWKVAGTDPPRFRHLMVKVEVPEF